MKRKETIYRDSGNQISMSDRQPGLSEEMPKKLILMRAAQVQAQPSKALVRDVLRRKCDKCRKTKKPTMQHSIFKSETQKLTADCGGPLCSTS